MTSLPNRSRLALMSVRHDVTARASVMTSLPDRSRLALMSMHVMTSLLDQRPSRMREEQELYKATPRVHQCIAMLFAWFMCDGVMVVCRIHNPRLPRTG